jgi:hypothetical protein
MGRTAESLRQKPTFENRGWDTRRPQSYSRLDIFLRLRLPIATQLIVSDATWPPVKHLDNMSRKLAGFELAPSRGECQKKKRQWVRPAPGT